MYGLPSGNSALFLVPGSFPQGKHMGITCTPGAISFAVYAGVGRRTNAISFALSVTRSGCQSSWTVMASNSTSNLCTGLLLQTNSSLSLVMQSGFVERSQSPMTTWEICLSSDEVSWQCAAVITYRLLIRVAPQL